MLRNILESRDFSARVTIQIANRMVTERQWSVVDAAPSGQCVRSGALFFTPEIIFITDIIPLRSVFNLCCPYEILFWE